MNNSLRFPRPDHTQLRVYNTLTQPLAAGSAAAAADTGSRSSVYSPVVFGIRQAAEQDEFWGILNQTLAPGECGSLTISGIVMAKIVSGEGMFASPGSNGLTAQNSGRARILYRGDADEESLLLLQEQSASQPVTTNFQVEYDRSVNRIRIFCGFYDNGSYCGITDLPGAEEVPPTELPLPESGWAWLYLNACCDSEKNYYTEFSYSQGGFANQLIARVNSNGTVIQYFTGMMIGFKREWFL